MDFLTENGNKRLHEINYGLARSLGLAMRKNWELVLKHMPNLPLNQLEIEQHFGTLEIQNKNPAEAFFSVLGRRGVRLNDLKDSFLAIRFEEGLRLISFPQIALQAVQHFPREMQLTSGSQLKLYCQVTGFPFPKVTYLKDGYPISSENPLIIENVGVKNSGNYECRITQEYNSFLAHTKVTVKDLAPTRCLISEEFYVKVEPVEITQDVGSKTPIEIKAIVESRNPRGFRYQWFKRADNNSQDEAINPAKNSTANEQVLVIHDPTVDTAGKYTCQVSDGTRIIMASAMCKVKIRTESPYDLKMALLIGNGDYLRHDCSSCEESQYHFVNLSASKGLIELKRKLEDNDFIVMTCIDLEADNFLRVIRLFKEKCESVQKVLAFIYIGAHGFHYGTHDFAVPADIQDAIHDNHNLMNEVDSCKHLLGLCSLANVLENFFQTAHTKFTVICLWDLCRQLAIDFPSDAYNTNCENLDYIIIFCCNVGASAFEVKGEGSIVLNTFLDEFKKGETLFQIIGNVQKRIDEHKLKVKDLERLKNLSLHATIQPLGDIARLSDRAKRTGEFRSLIEELYFKSFNHRMENCIQTSNGEVFSFSYKFLRDEFLNTIILEIQRDGTFYPVNVTSPNKKIRIEILIENIQYRIKGLQNLKPMEQQFDCNSTERENGLFINLEFIAKDKSSVKTTITLPWAVFSICKQLYSPSINEYVRDKQEMLQVSLDSLTSAESSVYGGDDQNQEECDLQSERE